MMEYIKIRNWDKWQTYRKDRGQPPWIKVHRCVMRDPEWVLTDAERGQLVAMWLLAADRNGVIPASPKIIQKLCFMEKPPNINKFAELGFIEIERHQCDVNMASGGSQSDQPKAETEKKREEKKKNRETSIPTNFCVSDRVKKWAKEKGYTNLEDHLEAFKLSCSAKGYKYINWDSAFMKAIRDNWAKINQGDTNGAYKRHWEPQKNWKEMEIDRAAAEANRLFAEGSKTKEGTHPS